MLRRHFRGASEPCARGGSSAMALQLDSSNFGFSYYEILRSSAGRRECGLGYGKGGFDGCTASKLTYMILGNIIWLSRNIKKLLRFHQPGLCIRKGRLYRHLELATWHNIFDKAAKLNEQLGIKDRFLGDACKYLYLYGWGHGSLQNAYKALRNPIIQMFTARSG